MRLHSVTNNNLKGLYFETLYLASFFAWSARKPGNATGHRSPINGKPYTSAHANHHKAYKAGQIATAKSYFSQAAQIRHQLQKMDILIN